MRYQQTELTSRPHFNILALLDKINGSKYEKTPNRLSVKGLTHYTSELITEAEELTYEEYKFLHVLGRLNFPFSEIHQNGNLNNTMDELAKILNEAYNNNYKLTIAPFIKLYSKMDNNNLLVKRNETAVCGPFPPYSKEKFRPYLTVTDTELSHKRNKTSSANRFYPLPSDIPSDSEAEKYLTNTNWTPRPLNADRPTDTTIPGGTRWCKSCGLPYLVGEHPWKSDGSIDSHFMKIYGKIADLHEQYRRIRADAFGPAQANNNNSHHHNNNRNNHRRNFRGNFRGNFTSRKGRYNNSQNRSNNRNNQNDNNNNQKE